MVVLMVVQELQWDVAAACSGTGAASNIAVTEKCSASTERTEMCQNVFATGAHLGWVACCVICRQKITRTSHLERCTHALYHLVYARVPLA